MKKNKTCFSKSTALAVICLFLFSSCSSENKDVQTTSAETTTVVTTSPKIEEPASEDEPIKWAEYISDSYVELIDYTQTESDNGKYNISICAVADLATNPELTVKNLYKQSRLIFRQFKKCRTLDMLSVSFVDEQENSKVYMSYDISKKKISSQKVDDEKWDGEVITRISENFVIDDSLTGILKSEKEIREQLDPVLSNLENYLEKSYSDPTVTFDYTEYKVTIDCFLENSQSCFEENIEKWLNLCLETQEKCIEIDNIVSLTLDDCDINFNLYSDFENKKMISFTNGKLTYNTRRKELNDFYKEGTIRQQNLNQEIKNKLEGNQALN